MHTIQWGAITHRPFSEYRHTLSDGRVVIRLITGRGDFDKVDLLAADMYGDGASFNRADTYPMERLWRDENQDCWQSIFARSDPRIHYLFKLCQDQNCWYKDQENLYPETHLPHPDLWVYYPYPHTYPSQAKPDWAKGCVGYQIFPDRFSRDAAADHSGETVEPWVSTNYANEYRFGGNLAGIRKAVPYLKSLGVDVVYMTPIFVSDTSHRYNTFDYFTIDPLLGTLEDLRGLSRDLHAQGMRIVMDGVFNHSGTAFAPFQDAVAKGPESPYYDWFFFDEKYNFGYLTFSHTEMMPKLNLQNPNAADYFLEVGRYWLKEAEIDGWRLDVSPEVWPDFWRQFRKAVQQENPNALIVAECWDDSRLWLNEGDMFDSTMNYVFSRAQWRFFGDRQISLHTFDAKMNRLQMMYPHPVQQVLWNFLDSHDTARFYTMVNQDMNRWKAAVFFQMTTPGVPILYYGDELGLPGGPDPDCRRPMPWDQVEGNPFFAFCQKLTGLRHESPALRLGSFQTYHVGENGLYGYLRKCDTQQALVLLNTSDTLIDQYLPLPFAAETPLTDSFSAQPIAVSAGSLRVILNPGEGMIVLGDA